MGHHGVERRGRGAGRVLREQRRDEDAVAAGGPEAIQRFANAGIAVAHAELDRGEVRGEAQVLQPLTEVTRHQGLLLDAVQQQRRTLGRPDHRVFLRRARGPRPQDHPVQQQHPDGTRNLDDAPIRQELGEVSADGRGRRRVRRAEIREQDADSHRPVVLKRRFRKEGAHGRPALRLSPLRCPRSAITRRAGGPRDPCGVDAAGGGGVRSLAPLGERLRGLGAHRRLHRRQPAEQRLP